MKKNKQKKKIKQHYCKKLKASKDELLLQKAKTVAKNSKEISTKTCQKLLILNFNPKKIWQTI